MTHASELTLSYDQEGNMFLQWFGWITVDEAGGWWNKMRYVPMKDFMLVLLIGYHMPDKEKEKYKVQDPLIHSDCCMCIIISLSTPNSAV